MTAVASGDPTSEALPASYDTLVSIDRLRHGEYNPRQVRPRSELIESIKQDGLQQPLIVRPAESGDQYHITDGWQRYQAATQLGWEQLPVEIYETALDALSATETASIVREWSTYEWAQYCQAVAAEVNATNHTERARKVASRVTKSRRSVKRYLAALALPTEVHPLLPGGPDGSKSDWQALQNYNAEIRQYGDLSWRVAERLGRAYRDGTISTDRAIGLAANAVAFEDDDDAIAMIKRGTEEPELPLITVNKLVQQAATQGDYLQVPSMRVPLSKAKRQAIMRHCVENRTQLSTIVASRLQELADELKDSR